MPPLKNEIQGLHLYHFEIYSTTAMHPTSCISISLSLSNNAECACWSNPHSDDFTAQNNLYQDFPIRWKSYQVYCSYRTIWINSRKLLPWTQPPHQSSSGYLARIKDRFHNSKHWRGQFQHSLLNSRVLKLHLEWRANIHLHTVAGGGQQAASFKSVIFDKAY